MLKLNEIKEKLEQKRKAIKSVSDKVFNAVEAMINCLSCSNCMEIVSVPITCWPCGHTFCAVKVINILFNYFYYSFNLYFHLFYILNYFDFHMFHKINYIDMHLFWAFNYFEYSFILKCKSSYDSEKCKECDAEIKFFRNT